MESEWFATPEEAALAEWRDLPTAHAHVLEVRRLSEGEAIVIVDTVPSHPMACSCDRSEHGWRYVGENS